MEGVQRFSIGLMFLGGNPDNKRWEPLIADLERRVIRALNNEQIGASYKAPRRKRSYVAVALAAASIVVVSLVIGTSGTQPGQHAGASGGSQGSQPKPRSALATEIDQFAVDWASGSGDNAPSSVTWGTCPGTGVAALQGECPPGVEEYVLVLSGGGGTFTIYAAGHGGTAPTASYAVLAVQTSNWDVLGINLSPTFVDISSDLQVETDSLSGITPISTRAFNSRFHVKG